MVAKIAYAIGNQKSATRHYIGLPPDLAGPSDMQQEFPPARVLLLRELEEGGFLLDRLAVDGSEAGDTWHQSVAEAENQAKFEYGDALSAWQDIPATVVNVQQFAVQCARGNVPMSS